MVIAKRDDFAGFGSERFIYMLTTEFVGQPAGVRWSEQRVCCHDAGHGERHSDKQRHGHGHNHILTQVRIMPERETRKTDSIVIDAK